MQETKDNLINKINENIRDGKIKMKPKLFFVLKSFLLSSFVLIIFLASLYIGNFILLIFYEYTESFNILHRETFHFYKFLDFLKIIPWLLFLLIFIFILSLYKLTKDYAFIYRRNILYTILFIFLILIIFIINIHLFLDNRFEKIKFGEKDELPVVSHLHKYYRAKHFKPSRPKDLNNIRSKSVKKEQILNN